MKRLFIAIKIDPDPAFLKMFRAVKSSLWQERIKWVEENNLHMTLKFLGGTPVASIPEIVAILETTAVNICPFDYTLRKLGVFGSRYAPRVIWAGLEPPEKFRSLMKTIQENLEQTGFRADRQNLVPHLTLGRIKSITDRIIFQRTIDQFANYSSTVYKAEFLTLYESILTSAGPQYHILRKCYFNKNAL